MSIQFIKPLNAQEIYNHIQERINDAERTYQLWKVVQSCCNKFEGKVFSKRIETMLKKELPDYTIYYEHSYGMFMLKIWGSWIKYDSRKQFYLGYDHNPFFDAAHILETNQWAELEQGRAERLHKITFEMLQEQVNKWNAGLAEMQAVYSWSEQFEIQYSSYGFDLNTR